MSKPGFSYGLNISKKSSASKPPPPKRKPVFGGDDDSDDDRTPAAKVTSEEAILDFDGTFSGPSDRDQRGQARGKIKNGPPAQPPKLKAKGHESAMFGDLSSTLTSRKHAQDAEALDASIYDYDAVYDSLKPQKKETKADVERKPKYMDSVIAAAAVRKRDALIAEEKKIAREREAEGDEFADKEKFVTEAYRRQQEENRRLEEEERRREEAEAKKNQSGGMTAFYRRMLDRGDERHAEVMKAAEERAKDGPQPQETGGKEEEQREKSDAELAREINARGGSIAINEEGQVVDKRQLLKGGLNVAPKKSSATPPKLDDRTSGASYRNAGDRSGDGRGLVGAGGGKQAMRERQSRMLEAQLEQALKRSLEEEEEERKETERVNKSRKTEKDISSAKERYLARKREAEEAKKRAAAEGA